MTFFNNGIFSWWHFLWHKQILHSLATNMYCSFFVMFVWYHNRGVLKNGFCFRHVKNYIHFFRLEDWPAALRFRLGWDPLAQEAMGVFIIWVWGMVVSRWYDILKTTIPVTQFMRNFSTHLRSAQEIPRDELCVGRRDEGPPLVDLLHDLKQSKMDRNGCLQNCLEKYCEWSGKYIWGVGHTL